MSWLLAGQIFALGTLLLCAAAACGEHVIEFAKRKQLEADLARMECARDDALDRLGAP